MLVALSWWVQEDPGQAQPGSEEAEKNCCIKTGQGLKDCYIVIPYRVLCMALILDTFRMPAVSTAYAWDDGGGFSLGISPNSGRSGDLIDIT